MIVIAYWLNCDRLLAIWQFSHCRISFPEFLETRAPQLKNRQDGTEYTLNRSSGLDGTIAYTFESSEEPIQESNIEVTVPVLYVEVPADETLTIPLNGASDLIDIEVKEDANGLVLSFTSMDLYHLPYDLVLISGGDAYDNFASLETSSMLKRYISESYNFSD